MKRYKMFINGDFADAAEGATRTIINPATEKEIAVVPEGSAEDVDRGVAAAAAAFEGWSESTPADRSTALLKLADVIDTNAEELATLEADNVGKPIGLARSEIPFMTDNLRFFAGAARVMEGKAAGEYLAGYTSMIRREPVGVVASIAPWNYPLMMAVWKIDLPWPLETPWCSSPPSRRPSPPCGWLNSPPTSSRRAYSTSSPATASPWAPVSSATRE